MKVVLLAGGLGTRLSEETNLIPKPMVEIGGKPIIWHIMKYFSSFGFNDFVICAGYKDYVIKEYFFNYMLHQSDIRISLQSNQIELFNSIIEPWNIEIIQTGKDSQTGGRLLAVRDLLGSDDFFMTYGDGLSNVDLHELLKNHQTSKKIVTVTAVQPQGRFGALHLNEKNEVIRFDEKPKGDGNWINGGFFVCSNKVFDYIPDLLTSFETKPLEDLANNNELNAYFHTGFWKPMDILRDKNELDKLWNLNQAPWKIWK